jgi:phosphoenolpyruvate-protein phosphotransferase (PTS system enzyme I)
LVVESRRTASRKGWSVTFSIRSLTSAIARSGATDYIQPVKRLKGIGASEGIAIGTAELLTSRVVVVDRWVSRELVRDEIQRFEAAVDATDRQLKHLSRQLKAHRLHDGHLLIEAHRLMLRSHDLWGASRSLIGKEALAAEPAVRRVVDGILAKFDKITDPYLRERGGDVEAVGERLLSALLGLPEVRPHGTKAMGAIGVGKALSPIDAFHLHRFGFAGLATERGGKTSHAAIVVRALGIPYVLGIEGLCGSILPGAMLIVDGGRGEVIVDPDADTLAAFQEQRSLLLARADELRSKPVGATATSDGVRVHIGANIEALSEIATAVEIGADSIGLFRTEFLYFDRSDLPTEDEQYRDAVSALTQLGGRVATFRTLDLGGEKLPLAVELPPGANPSLGVRAIRFSLRRPDIFRSQLRALYRASAAGPLRIMFPLISGIAELTEAQTICAEIREELDREGTAFDPEVPIGAMIETPSAAVTTDHLGEHCDFFSIGTNDLIQYAFAADRENQEVDHLYHPLHPALLRLLKVAIEGAAVAGKPISVCGDMAGDPAFTWVLLGLGIRELSMAPTQIPAVRSVIATTRLAEAQEMTARVLALRSDRQAEDLVMTAMRQRFPIELAGG